MFVYFTLWVRKEIKFGYSCFLGKILHLWYRQSSFLHSATPRARDGLSVSRVQDFAEKALVPKLDSYNNDKSSYEMLLLNWTNFGTSERGLHLEHLKKWNWTWHQKFNGFHLFFPDPVQFCNIHRKVNILADDYTNLLTRQPNHVT